MDIKDPTGRSLLQRLLARADVFVQNLAPGAAARAGLCSAALRKRHPALITVDMSGYGTDGGAVDGRTQQGAAESASKHSHTERKAYDMLVQAEVGLAHLSGARR